MRDYTRHPDFFPVVAHLFGCRAATQDDFNVPELVAASIDLAERFFEEADEWAIIGRPDGPGPVPGQTDLFDFDEDERFVDLSEAGTLTALREMEEVVNVIPEGHVVTMPRSALARLVDLIKGETHE